jgi:predicted molibdopterin-dependent oxidoreductase YjgC
MTGSAEHFWHSSDIMKLTYMPKREYNATLLLYPQGYIEISSIDAENKKLRNKEIVKVSSAAGDIEAQVKINSDLKEGYAHIPFFIRNSISDFLNLHDQDVVNGEDGVVKVTIEKV